MKIKFKWAKKVFLGGGLVFLVILVPVVIWLSFQTASHDRDWELGQEKLARFVFDGDDFEIRNYRNFNWEKNSEGKAGLILGGCATTDELADKGICYETRKYKLSDIQTVNDVISHFDDFEGLAHIFISFVMKDSENIVISMETRREAGEEFSPYAGILRQFEIIYVVGSEKDIVGLRTRVRGERVYIYPTIAQEDKAKELLLSLAKEINAIYEKPKIYNTLTHNCTNEITRRVEEISTLEFPLTWKTILPGYFDEILYEMKIIPTDKTFEEIKARYKVDNTTAEY